MKILYWFRNFVLSIAGRKACLFSLFLLFFGLSLLAQSIQLNYKQEPLNEVLLELNQRYQVQFSISSELSAKCLITSQARFTSLDKALEYLAQQCGLKLSKISNVYVFNLPFPPKQADSLLVKKKSSPTYLFQGIIEEAQSGEPLPYTLISLNNGNLVSDEDGRFSFRSKQAKERLQFRHLSYEITDTLLPAATNLRIRLSPRPELLEEIEVSQVREVADIHLGPEVGHIKFNDIRNNLVPGESINLIFNNLRLYPGITAAGESNADYVIWGSYAGQNHIIFDGITMFNSWGINTDLGRVNPFFIKNVEVFKGGYNVPYGDRIGGVVLIEGKSGSQQKPEMALSLSNQIGSAYFSIPLFNHSTRLQLGLRKSYYQFLDLELNPTEENDFIEPTYDYGDLNAKLSTALSNQDFLEINFIASKDDYQGDLTQERKRVSENLQISSFQMGSSLKYSHQWTKGGISSFLFSQSLYRPELSSNFTFEAEAPPMQRGRLLNAFSWENEIQEYQLQFKHLWSSKPRHQWEFSSGLVYNQATQISIDQDKVLDDQESALSRWKFYLMDQIQVNPRLRLQVGFKMEVPLENIQLYAQPRLNLNLQLSEYWHLQAGWGLYNQFITKNTVTDRLGNRTDIWQVSDGEGIPVLKSMHQVLGFSYLRDQFELNLEGYYKISEGQTRFVLDPNPSRNRLEGEARALGLDILLKKKFWGHEVLLAYSLAEVEESYRNRSFLTEYISAPHSQNHEFKSALVLNFLPFK
ncbi:MAG: TonB-dependent receptor plug domain-containing protein, partial [Bacteroidota bacterium]